LAGVKEKNKKDDFFDCKGKNCKDLIKAPEIDAASGTLPLALLTGVVVLMKERSRSKRKDNVQKLTD